MDQSFFVGAYSIREGGLALMDAVGSDCFCPLVSTIKLCDFSASFPQVVAMNIRPFRVWIACLVLLLTGVSARAEEPPPEVPVARAVLREVTDYEDFAGRTEAASRVELRARVTGYLVKTLVKAGAEVKKGDVLFEIDSRNYRAELDRAEAAVKVAEARLKLAEANHKRAKTLHDRKSISQEEFDRTTAEQVVAEGEVLVTKAVRALAQLNLDFTRVLAPIDGRVGRLTVTPGNLVEADKTILATLVSLDPLYVYLDVDERSALRLLREAKGKAEKVPVAVGLADEEGFPRRGVLDFTDNQLNPDTGTLRMRAVLPNKDGLLMPGLFVRVRLAMGAPHKALTVPQKAVGKSFSSVLYGRERWFVSIVNDKDVIEAREVALGPRAVVVGQWSDEWRVVTRGVKADERVVVGWPESLRPGMVVRPREGKKPSPKPKQSPKSSPASSTPPMRGHPGSGLLVEAVYPGANAEVGSDTVRSPIEQQINGVEKLRSMRARAARAMANTPSRSPSAAAWT